MEFQYRLVTSPFISIVHFDRSFRPFISGTRDDVSMMIVLFSLVHDSVHVSTMTPWRCKCKQLHSVDTKSVSMVRMFTPNWHSWHLANMSRLIVYTSPKCHSIPLSNLLVPIPFLGVIIDTTYNNVGVNGVNVDIQVALTPSRCKWCHHWHVIDTESSFTWKSWHFFHIVDTIISEKVQHQLKSGHHWHVIACPSFTSSMSIWRH